MPRQEVAFQPNSVYHVYNRAIGNENLFRNSENYRYFLKKYEEYMFPVLETYAYCLMPNHFHLMVRIRPEENLKSIYYSGKIYDCSKFVSQRFSNFLNSYSKSYNNVYGRHGSLFQQNIKRKEVSNEYYFSRLIAYIHLNPIYHGFVTSPEDWLHSSYHAYLSAKPTKLHREEALNWFGGLAEFTQVHQDLKYKDIFQEFDL